jgi:hypothetical protein
MMPKMLPAQGSVRREKAMEIGIIPRLWNDLLRTVTERDDIVSSFGFNPRVEMYAS